MKEETDEVIVQKVQEGDREAFGLLVERYEQKLLRYAGRFLFDREDREELVQDVFLRAYQNIRSFDVTRKFNSWIYRIAHNVFVNGLRLRERMPVTLFDPDAVFPHLVAEETADSEAIRHEMRELLDTHLRNLHAKYREPLVLFYFQELNYQEIADIMKIPVSTVGVRINRGRALLRAMITEDAV